MEERRTERRTRVLLPARILTNGRASLACSIRDLTEGGARLHVPAPEQVPERFDLVIDRMAAGSPARPGTVLAR